MMELHMTNQELADVFDRIANLMKIQGEMVFKIRAYERAAETLRALGEEASAIAARGELTSVPGIGKAIAEKIEELLQTGRLGFLERLEEEVPPSLLELLKVPGVGPKKVALFWKECNILTLDDLKKAAEEGRLRSLPGMGEKSEASILAGIASLAQRSRRMTLGRAWEAAQRWLGWLRSQAGVERAEPAGSLRRWKETIGDLDLVIAHRDPVALMQAFTSHPEVARTLGQGENKSSIELRDGARIQLWAQPPESFGALWQYATGSKDHNVRLRELAQKKGLSLSERGLLDEAGNLRRIADEADLYAALGLEWIPPELREDRGEIEAAARHALPRLVTLEDIRADLHCHTTWSDGVSTIEEMARAAIQHGYHVLAITDHSSYMGIVGGMKPEDLPRQKAEIAAVQQKLGDQILLLQGAEVDIRSDGIMDYPDEVLASLDLVIASLHTSLRQPREQITARLLNAIRNPHVDIIAHPTGRLLPDRSGADLDWQAVFAALQENGTALEINASPSRLDADDAHTRYAASLGIPIVINTDAHAPGGLHEMRFGVAVARRAWLEAPQVINTWETHRLLDWLKQRGKR
ncbi:DNA polymerase IV [Anaerolinea thermolimosa]|uniref:DNA polymerase/3'-5' exonuclease PolX n=1 Tax=Anaerolinea thermolimosa TaxID=229919 RepID=UPI0007841565|nr:DNA polymerase/3'-5' exonuclease PolX [Anaerolinea thermolimosa]GAP07601.1 DNA polymerase IV [Anaerolinea thermolimosa]